MHRFCIYPYDDNAIGEYTSEFSLFLLANQELQKAVIRILLKEDVTKHYGLAINVIELLEYNQRLATLLIAHPEKMVPILDESIKEAEQELMQKHPRQSEMIYKSNVHARLNRLNMCDQHMKIAMPRSIDIGLFVEIQGTVIRTGVIKSLEWEKIYECSSCKYRFSHRAEIEMKNQFPKIINCPSLKRDKPCNSRGFRALEDSAKCRDYQEIKIQENVGKIGVGSMPKNLIVVLMDDLVDICKAGEEVTVSGILKKRWKTPWEGERCDVEIFLDANNVRVSNQQRYGHNITEELIGDFRKFWEKYQDRPLEGRNLILKSICPNIYGMFLVKLAIACCLIGGVQRNLKSGMKTRGESHLLLVGEPGTGKSQFLKFASALTPRSVLTTGIGTTSAGLTVSAVKEAGGEWMLEAGALVLADGGICCIDEFSSIKERDRTTIHEAMEQQTLSVAKAGLVVKLQTRCTVIAATNAKGKYDPLQSISVNTTLASPLLSRFDLVLILIDDQNVDWDKKLSTFILQSQSEISDGTTFAESMIGIWNIQVLRAYILHVKNLRPELSPESKEILTAYYKKQRAADIKNTARTTIRLLESLIRIAEAHARLMYRKVVTIQDALMSILLMECSMHTSALLGVSSTLHSMFPEDPQSEYEEIESQLLKRLGLNHLLNIKYETQEMSLRDFSNEDNTQDDNEGEFELLIDKRNGKIEEEETSPSTGKFKVVLTTDDKIKDQCQSENLISSSARDLQQDIDQSFDLEEEECTNDFKIFKSLDLAETNSPKKTPALKITEEGHVRVPENEIQNESVVITNQMVQQNNKNVIDHSGDDSDDCSIWSRLKDQMQTRYQQQSINEEFHPQPTPQPAQEPFQKKRKVFLE